MLRVKIRAVEKRSFVEMCHQIAPYGVILLLSVLSWQVFGQAPTSPDTSGLRKVEVDYADVYEYVEIDTGQLQKLKGHVELRQDSIFLYCDSARLYNENFVVAVGNVIVQQGDSLSAFGDSVVYDSQLEEARMFGEVVMVNGDNHLYTDRLNYDLEKKVATYYSGATMVRGDSRLTSKKGYYYVDSETIYFKDSVTVVDPRFSLRADTLQYDLQQKTVIFLGPTRIVNDSSQIYCEGGFYGTESGQASFWDNAQYVRGDQKARADTIAYDGRDSTYALVGSAWFQDGDTEATADKIIHNEAYDLTILKGNAFFQDSIQQVQADLIEYNAKSKTYRTKGRSFVSDPPNLLYADEIDFEEATGLGIAKGDVIWSDTSADVSIVCERADYERESGYLLAVGGELGRPYLMSRIDEDTLYMAADTLLSLVADTSKADSSRLMVAFPDVRIFKPDIQGTCDSMVYHMSDSLFYLYQNPIMWSDTSQFTADTMRVQMANNSIDRIFMYDNSLIVNSPDELFFNQIQGRQITAFFYDGDLGRMDVNGNATSVYYALDESNAYIGVNKVICSDMIVYFGDNQVERINFRNKPKGLMTPMDQADHESMRLDGFSWKYRLRPKQFEDLFDIRSSGQKPKSKTDDTDQVDLESPASALDHSDRQ